MQKHKRRLGVAALGVVALVVSSSTPAAAATGTGEHEGTMTITTSARTFPSANEGPCATSALSYTTTVLPTGEPAGRGDFNDFVLAYNGPVSVSFSVPTVYHNPTGTWSDPKCRGDGPGYPHDIGTVTISGTAPFAGVTTKVDCTWSLGTYSRIGEDHLLELPRATGTNPAAGTSGTCTLKKEDASGNVIGTPSTTATALTMVGTTVACTNVPVPPPPASCENAYSFTAT